MLKNKILALLLIITLNLSAHSHRYVPMDNHYYHYIEYKALNSNSLSIFMLTQPYKYQQIQNLIDLPSDQNYLQNILTGCSLNFNDTAQSSIALDLAPGLMAYSDHKFQELSRAIHLDGAIAIGGVTLANRIKLDQSVKYDPDFHGDSSEWLMGYLTNSYMNVSLNDNIDLFAGRLGRNFGIINDYGLLLSNNPYNFDHFGFRSRLNSMQYSFYFTRLNDMLGTDTQGSVIPIGQTINTHRYWAVQKFDWAIFPDLQISLAEATIYGGPNQDFVAAYLNPVNFFYASQRNQGYQMSGLWQIAGFYRPFQGIGLYLDLFADDLIANNESIDQSGTMPRDVYPDRLGINAKISMTDIFLSNTLTSLRYARIWNHTYTSFRNFENYIYFNKSLGFPLNSYEGLKLSTTYFLHPASLFSLSLEIWQHGNHTITELFNGEKEEFPAKPVTYGLNIDLYARTILFKKFEAEFAYTPVLTASQFRDIFTSPSIDHRLQLKIYYHITPNFQNL